MTSIAYLLNLRGDDIPYNPLFHSYLFVGRDQSVLFVDKTKVNDEVGDYLKSIRVDIREYNDLWTFLRRREWGEGKASFFPHCQ
jgi:Xaa-Pro aminopeptidase